MRIIKKKMQVEKLNINNNEIVSNKDLSTIIEKEDKDNNENILITS